MATVAKVKRSLNPDLSILGVIINAFDCVPVITRQIRNEIEEAFGEKVFESVLSKSIRIEEAIAAGRGITGMTGREYRKTREEVAALGEELLGRIRPRIQVEA
jgi:chromosome partitioning protein